MAAKKASDDLELYPQPKVQRLNRLAVLLVALAALVVLWTVYFVLTGRKPTASTDSGPPPAVLESGQMALEQLERRALAPDPSPLEALFGPPVQLPPKPTPPKKQTVRSSAPRATTPSAASPQVLQLERARHAEVLVAGFGTTSLRSGRSTTLGGGDDLGGVEEELEALRARLAGYGQAAPEAGLPPEVLPATVDHRVQSPSSPFVLQEGSLLPAILTTRIVSDLPGPAQALVRRNVYDSVTGRHLLIPQGSKLLGSYDHRIVWGQRRVLLEWHRVLFPNGRSLDLADLPGTDLLATAGLHDQVNNHFIRTFGSALLLSAISAGTQLSQPQESFDGNAASARQIAAAALGQEIGRLGSEITQRNVSRQPTLTIRPGFLFHVVTTSDIEMPGPYPSPR